jgi:hypothetical protein
MVCFGFLGSAVSESSKFILSIGCKENEKLSDRIYMFFISAFRVKALMN